jgi:hypothetical protein
MKPVAMMATRAAPDGTLEAELVIGEVLPDSGGLSLTLDDGDRIVLDVDDVLALIAEDAGETEREAA